MLGRVKTTPAPVWSDEWGWYLEDEWDENGAWRDFTGDGLRDEKETT